jgi:thymidylate synthase (FAD)
MKVRLVSYSQPDPDYFGSAAVEDGKITSEDLIAYCARVSNPGNQDNHSSSSGLLSYLVKHKHWSPFEMVSACLEIETTRDIARQILRHRSFSFQEFSQRYADPTKELEFVTRETRLQDQKNRQNSIEIENDPSIQLNTTQQEFIADWRRRQHGIIKQAQAVYEWAIEHGIAKEQARAVLPEGLVTSRLYMNGTIRSWLHYIELRSGVETQKEHREVAIKCGEVLEKVFPSILKVAKGK